MAAEKTARRRARAEQAAAQGDADESELSDEAGDDDKEGESFGIEGHQESIESGDGFGGVGEADEGESDGEVGEDEDDVED